MFLLIFLQLTVQSRQITKITAAVPQKPITVQELAKNISVRIYQEVPTNWPVIAIFFHPTE